MPKLDFTSCAPLGISRGRSSGDTPPKLDTASLDPSSHTDISSLNVGELTSSNVPCHMGYTRTPSRTSRDSAVRDALLKLDAMQVDAGVRTDIASLNVGGHMLPNSSCQLNRGDIVCTLRGDAVRELPLKRVSTDADRGLGERVRVSSEETQRLSTENS